MPRKVVPYTDTMSSWLRRHVIVVDFNSSYAYISLLGRVRHRHIIVVDFLAASGVSTSLSWTLTVRVYISSWPRRASAHHRRGLQQSVYTSLLGRVGRRHIIIVDFNSPCIHLFLAASIVVCLISNNQQTFSRLIFINFLFVSLASDPQHFQSCQVVLSDSVADSRPYIRRDDNYGLLRSTPQTRPAAQCIDPPP